MECVRSSQEQTPSCPVYIYELENGRQLHDPIQVGRRIDALHAFDFDGEPHCAIAAQTNQQSNKYAILIYNLRTGSMYAPPKYYLDNIYSGYKSINRVSSGYLKGDPVIIAGLAFGEVYVVCVRDKTRIGTSRDRDGYVQCLATGLLHNQPIILSGMTKGQLNLLSLESAMILKSRPSAHKGGVPAVAISKIENQTCLLSGGGDGIVKVWSQDLEELYRVETNDAVVGIAPMTDSRIAVATTNGLMVLRLHNKS